MGENIVIASGKGGTGKTTAVSAIGSYLATYGKKVLCVDCDIEMKDLDLILGMHNFTTRDLYDVIKRGCALEEAMVPHPEIPGLYFLSAPVDIEFTKNDLNKMREVMRKARRMFDYCLFDAPAGNGIGYQLAVSAANKAIVVSTVDSTAMRDVQRIVSELRKDKIKDIKLIVNRIQPKLLKKMKTTIDDVIDETGAQLLGLVPEDSKIILSESKGVVVSKSRKGKGKRAFDNITKRIMGEKVPLMRF